MSQVTKFPLLIYLPDTQELKLVRNANLLPVGKPMIVLLTDVQDSEVYTAVHKAMSYIVRELQKNVRK